jgi:hypothetical protein
VVYDTNNNGVYDTGEPVILGPTPATGTKLKIDTKIKYVELQAGNFVWEAGEPVVYDSNGNGFQDPGEPIISGTPTGNGRYDTGESVIVGTTPGLGALLKTDPKIKYVNVTSSPTETWTMGKAVIYDSSGSGLYDAGASVLAGATPSIGTRLSFDPKVKYVNASNVPGWTFLPADVYYKIFDGTTWSGDVQFTVDPNFDQKPDATLTRDGRIWVVWQSNRINSQFDLFYKTFNGTAWSNDTLVFGDSDTSCSAAHPIGCDDLDPDILQDRNGTIQIFWSRARPTVLSPTQYPGEIYTISSIDNGLTFPMTNMQQMTFNNQLTQCPPPVACTIEGQTDSSPAVVELNQKLWVFWSRPSSAIPQDINIQEMPSNPIFTHDVKIASMTSPNTVRWNTTLQLNITVVNNGDFPENATVSWKIGTVVMGTCPTPFSLRPGETKNCLVQLKYVDTVVLKPGRYPVTAQATIPQEPLGNLPDNKFAPGTIALLPPGDMDSDGDVTLVDALLWIQAYGSRPGMPNWNPVADLNGNGVVDFADATILARWLGTVI